VGIYGIIDINRWGDELVANARTEDGFSFVQDRDRYYYYAKLDDYGEFTASDFKVGIDDPVANGIVRGLERSPERKAQIQAARERFESGDADVAGKLVAIQTAPPANVTIGIILVEFSDIKGSSSYNESDFEDMFFSTSYTAQRYKCGFPLEENASFVPVFSIYRDISAS